MTQNTQLRKQLFAKQDLGDHARDTQRAFDTIPRFVTRYVDGYYTEPMVLGSPVAGEEPESIELTRITSLVAPEQPVLCGSMVHYVWKPQNNGCVVTSIDGLSPSTSVKYRFKFRFTYPAKGQL
jgi:hypothetical protein